MLLENYRDHRLVNIISTEHLMTHNSRLPRLITSKCSGGYSQTRRTLDGGSSRPLPSSGGLSISWGWWRKGEWDSKILDLVFDLWIWQPLWLGVTQKKFVKECLIWTEVLRLLVIYRWSRICQDATGCDTMHKDFVRCHMMVVDIARCSLMQQDSSRCIRICQDAAGWIRMLSDAT